MKQKIRYAKILPMLFLDWVLIPLFFIFFGASLHLGLLCVPISILLVLFINSLYSKLINLFPFELKRLNTLTIYSWAIILCWGIIYGITHLQFNFPA